MQNQKKKVLIDVTSLFDQYAYRGIGRYIKSLLKELIPIFAEQENIELHLIGFEDLTQNLIAIGFSQFTVEELEKKIKFHSLGDPIDSGIKNIFRWKDFDHVIYEIEPSVYFAPHFERGLPTTRLLKHSFKKVKTVVTLHDLVPLRTQSFSQKGAIQNFIKKQFYMNMISGVQNAERVITVSNFSKEDAKTLLNITEDKIKVVYSGIDEKFFKSYNYPEESDQKEIIKRYGLTDTNYMLYDSGIEENKGAYDLLSVFALIQQNQSNKKPIKLVITGGGFGRDKKGNYFGKTPAAERFIKQAKELNIIDKLIFVGKIEEEVLIGLLKNSSIYFYPSRYEGFGFPPLQSIAAEIPTVINNASCLPEVSGDGSVIVDAQNHEESAKSIIEFLESESLIKQKKEAGLKLLEKYDWEKSAEETFNIINDLL